MPRTATYSDSRLARLCRHYGLRQQELAVLPGISPGFISQLESGTRFLTESEKRAAQRALIAATARQGNLQLSSAAVTGPTAYLADVDADQVDAQIATLDTAIQAVTARKAALPS